MAPRRVPEPRDVWDVVVVGAGPAGTTAAIASSAAGASTLVLDRAGFPRRKTCGGGLVGMSLAALPAAFRPPVRATVHRATFTLRNRLARTRTATSPLVSMVYREELDGALVDYARAAGVKVMDACPVSDLREEDDLVTLATPQGEVRARAVVGADGSAGRTGRYVGVRCQQIDLGLEVEVALPRDALADWRDRLLIDWGPLPGSYGWVFPKGTGLTVGVIAARGDGTGTRQYLDDLLAHHGLRGKGGPVSGHLTRCREPGSALHRGNVLVAGDAAGLLEPWTREGISFALRSGRMAGEAAARLARDDLDREEVAAEYVRRVRTELETEMRAGQLLFDAFTRRPAAFHAGIATLPPAWRFFASLVRGETSYTRLIRRRGVRALLRAI